jgi:TolB-like protein
VGTGGLVVEGEINLRQSAQYTMGKYIFLTYGEKEESEGGVPGSVSHHTGENFVSDKLEAIIIRFAKDDIALYSGKPLEEKDDYFEASDGKDRLAILKELFSSMVSQLVSYSSLSITKEMTAAVIPLDAADKTIAASAEYFTEQLHFAAAEYKGWKSVERKDIQKILNEIKFNLSGLADEASVIKLGQLSGAKLLITGTVYQTGDVFEIYLKLIDAETGETLSVTRGKADKKLGLQ